MSQQIEQSAVNKAVWRACDTFRGTLATQVYKDYVLVMLFLKFISDVWKEKYVEYAKQFPNDEEMIQSMLQTERFTLPKESSFYYLYEQRHEAGNGERIDKALHAIEEANIKKLAEVFQGISFNDNKLGDENQKNELLCHCLEDFHKEELNFSMSKVGNLDIIGGAYEYLIKEFAADSGKKGGEFYTPPEVSELISLLVEPKENDDIYDPTCGSASLLMKCGRFIREKYNSRKYALYGHESIGSTWALAKMNLFLHGEDNHRIEWADTLRNPKIVIDNTTLMKFDVVVANPPFSLDKWGYENASNDPFKRYLRGIPPRTKGDYAFISHMIESMKEKTGRMAVVVPHGVLFRGGAEGKIRTEFIKENLLDAVIGLPEKLFFGTGIPAAILVFRKDKKTKDIIFIDASHEYQSGKNQNSLRQEDLEKIISVYKNRLSVPKYAHLADIAEIEANEYNLNIPRYVDTFEAEEEIDMQGLLTEEKKLKEELHALEKQMQVYLKELGYE